MKKYLQILYALLTALILIGIVGVQYYYQTNSAQLSEGIESYYAGESAETIDLRKLYFNKSLEAFLTLEKKYEPRFGNGLLYYNIANAYYQLESYPRAVLYYYRAWDLRPFDRNIQDNLNRALKKLDLPPAEGALPIERVFFFHAILSLPQRLQLFFVFAFMALALTSLYLWAPRNAIKVAAALFAGIAAIFFLSLTLTYIVENPYGVVIQATNLYRGPGLEFASAREGPVKPGTKLSVIHIEEGGQWIKVASSNGDVGYIPLSSLLFI